ncbi:uncharacterized protein K460DRAFT_296911 [Cucurbitaria berberidis CBS 394.84]|uniref:Uncharacterized protein n=1 Tax=Cucurbitaria berberidis CBS 394.84 TaxID=1168544 RepID=A0A9P4L432_9PLEO|nr:uncharacterized protein K460DRAFT_296911 [Cucurbitaria berberidis CBS 394.84]KAF1840458.1 hypothetical protein K460DRAFT_296911 [Cucurbitaria berberidis CBS 394.84]
MFGTEPIYNDDDMEKYIKRTVKNVQPQDSPRVAIQRIRSVVGAFKYMQEKEVVKIFKDEKVRIGVVIDGIDKNLPKTPRVSGTKKYTPWKTLGLGAKWDRLKDEYTSQKAKDAAKDDDKKTPKERNEIAEWAKLREDIEKIIPKLEAEWNKAKGWTKPW